MDVDINVPKEEKNENKQDQSNTEKKEFTVPPWIDVIDVDDGDWDF